MYRDKVVGFGSHIQIELQFNNDLESSPMLVDHNLKKETITTIK